MRRGWMHSGFNVHRSQRVPPRNREDMERFAQYIIRNPFSVDKMQPNSCGDSIIYRSGMNPKIQRNFEGFSPGDFIARITQHIPDKSFQLVRYYDWYSNKMRGQRLKQTDAEAGAAPEGDVIDVSAGKPRTTKWLALDSQCLIWRRVRAWKSPLPATNSMPTSWKGRKRFPIGEKIVYPPAQSSKIALVDRSFSIAI